MKSGFHSEKENALPEKTRLSLFGWLLYDWANSGYALSVMTGFFPLFFKKYWCAGAGASASTLRLGIANSVAGILIAATAPFLGAFADAAGTRKKFLVFFMMSGTILTTQLFFVDQGMWLGAAAVFIFATYSFSSANIFYDSLLPVVSKSGRMDFNSSLGYGLGYLGCALLFAFNIWMIKKPEMFGLKDSTQSVRRVFISVSIWWFIFSIPLILFVKDIRQNGSESIVACVKNSLNYLRNTVRDILSRKELVLFLIAYWLYIDGVHTFIRMAADFGLSIGLKAEGLMVSLLIVQLVAFPSAILFGFIADRFGVFRALMAGIVIYLFVTLTGPFILKTQADYTFFAVLSALPLGCLQALSRSCFAGMVPVEKSAEYFGIYNLVGKFAVFLGPAVVGLVNITAGSLGAGEQASARTGFSSVALFFLSGALFLILSKKKGWASNEN